MDRRRYITILREGYEFDDRRYVLELSPTPLNPNAPMINEVTDRVTAIAYLAEDYFEEMNRGGHLWSMSVIMEYEGLFVLVKNPAVARNHFGRMVRRFATLAAIRNDLIDALLEAIGEFQQSATYVDFGNITVTLRFDRTLAQVAVARGKMKCFVKRTILDGAETKGLAVYDIIDGLCGFQAVIYAMALTGELLSLWEGDNSWYKNEFPNGEICIAKLRKGRQRFFKLCTELCRQLEIDPAGGWIVTATPLSTANTFVLRQPYYQIVIFNEVTRQIMEVRRGLLFDKRVAKESTILMSYTLGHLQLIKGPHVYFRKHRTSESNFCYLCLKIVTWRAHVCDDIEQCDRCLLKFNNDLHAEKHKTPGEFGQQTCPKCRIKFYNQHCLNCHDCRAKNIEICVYCNRQKREADHDCAKHKCHTCKAYVEGKHRCTLQKLEEPENKSAEEVGSEYWAFDFESLLISETDPKSRVDMLLKTTVPPDNYTPEQWAIHLRSISSHIQKHEVNLIIVRRCFAEDGEEDSEHIFRRMEDFVHWLESTKCVRTLFAHNLKGYDGRLVFDHLFDRHTPPQQVTFRGTKILKMQYGKVTFMDTLLHLPASLEQLPAMFGLDTGLLRKGVFPYKFNTPENQNYIGPIPDRSYFEPDKMPYKKREKFEEWYSSRANAVYDFKHELIEYCRSDVLILARAIEAYMRVQMRSVPLNPFSCTTIASYAMTMFRTYHMPEKSIGQLSFTEYERISKAMHGGRTDTRRLLREWSDDEVANGIYGKYQDVQSLYPTVQFYDPMPTGHPEYRYFTADNQPSLDEIKGVFGFICCDIHPTRYIHHPVLVDLCPKSHKLLADLKPKTKITLASPEMMLALDNGYVITKVYWYYKYEQSYSVFKSYFQALLKMKIEASGMPKWIKTEADWREFSDYHRNELGITLERDKMIKNPALKLGAKLLLNSLWGKFGEKLHIQSWRKYDFGADDDDILDLENKWSGGEIDVLFRKYTQDKASLGVLYTHNIGMTKDSEIFKQLRERTNMAIAAMVTSHARCRLWKELNKLGTRVLYHDTDSIIYEHNPNAYNIPEGRYLGEWEDETDGLPIVKFVSTGPKCYSYCVQLEDGSLKYDTKLKGITQNAQNSDRINYESMKKLVENKIDSIAADCLLFKYDRDRGQMHTKTTIKLFKKTYEKGYVDENTWKVYPFGWNHFLSPDMLP